MITEVNRQNIIKFDSPKNNSLSVLLKLKMIEACLLKSSCPL
ncbi:hypothetical protein MCHI_003639 [Candidatus Magnetoovum chiemensis]|nr:hypothetical protein MCHI_004121 [Candidatus Magnetoovum chiemensis]KJR40465.1 hypothetical protein MCHI_003639 [Candidatus Magnetoovum chiemensis]